MIAALALLLAPTPPVDPVAAAVAGLNPAEIEDDDGPDMPLLRASSAGCAVTVVGRDRTFVLDLAQPAEFAGEDTFIYVAAGRHRLAIVGDASRPDQDAKLTQLLDALTAIAARCRPPG